MEKCKHYGHELKENIKIPEMKLEITQIEKWNKSYNEIKIPKGYRLMEVWEFFKLEKEHPKIFNKIFKEKSVEYVLAQTNSDISNSRSRWLSRNGYLVLFARGRVLASSDSVGRVFFVRSTSKKKYDMGLIKRPKLSGDLK